MEFGVLGPLCVRGDEGEIAIRRGLPRTLLVALLLRPGDTLTAGALIDLLWGDEVPHHPANALQIQISYLRKRLASASNANGQVIATRPGGYALEVDPEAIDAARFERLVQRAATSEGEKVLADLDAALGLWRGDALAEVAAEGFAQGPAARLEDMRWTAHEMRNDALLALGRHRDVVGHVRTLVSQQPFRERFHEQLVLALYRCGRQAEALNAYESARATLLEELGLDPGPALQRLEQAVLNQDPSLDWVPSGSPRSSRRHRYVPAPLTPLIGRDDEVARVRALLGRSRLVTLTGPGGAGKSRLAIHIARMEAERQEVWYVDLGTVGQPQLVGPTVAATVNEGPVRAEEVNDIVASALADEQGVLVLDTCEHVVAGVAPLVGELLRRAPEMRVLATSRRPLGVNGEAAWPVPPLALAPPDAASVEVIASAAAVALFCARAEQVRPDFALDGSNAGDIARICLMLDGLPLAIELAAARADVLAPGTILDRLQDRFEFLVDGPADAAIRQQTLKGAIDWSVSLLTDSQRGFFARLGAFAGTFGIDAAVAVAGAPGDDGVGLLRGLVRHSMVVTAGGERFRLLDTVRDYARRVLDEADAAATRRRHAEHYLAVAERTERDLRGPSQSETLARLRADVPNFRAALDWSFAAGERELGARLAGSLAWYWALDGAYDATRYLERAATIESTPGRTRAKVVWGYSLLLSALGDLAGGRDAGTLGVDLARESGDDALIGSALNALAVAQWALGDLAAAAATHDEAIERFVRAGDGWGEALCRVLRARTALDRDEVGAEEHLRLGISAARQCGDAHALGLALELEASVLARKGERAKATVAATESLALQEAVGYKEGAISALHVLARLRSEDGEDAEAQQLLLRGLGLAWKVRHAAATCEALEGLAAVAARRGEVETALELLNVARSERSSRNVPVRARDEVVLRELRSELERLNPPVRGDVRPIEEVVRRLLG